MDKKIIVSEIVKGQTRLSGERFEFRSVVKLCAWLSRMFGGSWRASSGLAKIAAKASSLGLKMEVKD